MRIGIFIDDQSLHARTAAYDLFLHLSEDGKSPVLLSSNQDNLGHFEGVVGAVNVRKLILRKDTGRAARSYKRIRLNSETILRLEDGAADFADIDEIYQINLTHLFPIYFKKTINLVQCEPVTIDQALRLDVAALYDNVFITNEQLLERVRISGNEPVVLEFKRQRLDVVRLDAPANSSLMFCSSGLIANVLGLPLHREIYLLSMIKGFSAFDEREAKRSTVPNLESYIKFVPIGFDIDFVTDLLKNTARPISDQYADPDGVGGSKWFGSLDHLLIASWTDDAEYEKIKNSCSENVYLTKSSFHIRGELARIIGREL